MTYFDFDYPDDEQGYEVSVSCSSCGFRETDCAQFTETIDPLVARLVGKHKATGCGEQPKVYDVHGEGVATLEERAARANTL